MKSYGEPGNNSGVAAYEIADQHIKVRFKNGGTFVYSYVSAGTEHIEQMKILARRGVGLNTYINKYVKDSYE